MKTLIEKISVFGEKSYTRDVIDKRVSDYQKSLSERERIVPETVMKKRNTILGKFYNNAGRNEVKSSIIPKNIAGNVGAIRNRIWLNT